MAVDDVPDRYLRDLSDLRQVDLTAIGPAVADGVGGDDPLGGDDKHCLRLAVAEDVDTIRTIHLPRFERGLRGAGRRRLAGGRGPLRQHGAVEQGDGTDDGN